MLFIQMLGTGENIFLIKTYTFNIQNTFQTLNIKMMEMSVMELWTFRFTSFYRGPARYRAYDSFEVGNFSLILDVFKLFKS